MNPIESYGIDNPDFVTARMEEKAKEEERRAKGKKQIIDGLKYSQIHYHASYLLTVDWLKNYAKTGEEEFGKDNFKEDLENLGTVGEKKLNLGKEEAKDILQKLINKKEFEDLFGKK